MRPASACRAMLDACGPALQRRFGAGSVSLERDGAEWQVRGADGAVLAQAPTVVLANGAGATELAQAAPCRWRGCAARSPIWRRRRCRNWAWCCAAKPT